MGSDSSQYEWHLGPQWSAGEEEQPQEPRMSNLLLGGWEDESQYEAEGEWNGY